MNPLGILPDSESSRRMTELSDPLSAPNALTVPAGLEAGDEWFHSETFAAFMWGSSVATIPWIADDVRVIAGQLIAIGIMILLHPTRPVRRALIVAVAAGLTSLGAWCLGANRGNADSILLVLAGLGALIGVIMAWKLERARLPGLHFFRGSFLEFCVLTGLLAGFLSIPKLKFREAADLASRITFAVALFGTGFLVPFFLTSRLVARLRPLPSRGRPVEMLPDSARASPEDRAA